MYRGGVLQNDSGINSENEIEKRFRPELHKLTMSPQTELLEAALSKAVSASLRLRGNERLGFVAEHLLAQATSCPTLPSPEPGLLAARDELREDAAWDEDEVREELAILASTLSECVNEARGRPGWPLRAVADAGSQPRRHKLCRRRRPPPDRSRRTLTLTGCSSRSNLARSPPFAGPTSSSCKRAAGASPDAKTCRRPPSGRPRSCAPCSIA